MLRATQKLATVVEKPEAEESTLALGLAVRHIEGVLHPEAELDVSGAYFIRLDGRREIVQLFANIRAHTQSLLLTNRRAGIVDKMKNEITAHIDVDFALHFADLNEAGRAGATVYWEKTDAGWKIRRLEIVAPRKFIQPL